MHKSKKNGAVAVAGAKQVRAAAAAIAAAVSNAPMLVEAVDAVAARILTSPLRSVHVLTIRAANVVRKNHRRENVSGLACGLAAANAIHPSLNSRRSSPSQCVIVLTLVDAAVERRAKVLKEEAMSKSVAVVALDVVAMDMVATDMVILVMDLSVDMGPMDMGHMAGTFTVLVHSPAASLFHITRSLDHSQNVILRVVVSRRMPCLDNC